MGQFLLLVNLIELISKQLLKDVYGIAAEIMDDVNPKIVHKIAVKSYL